MEVVEGLLASEDLKPRHLALAAVGALDCGVEHAARGAPDVAAGAVPFDEGDDGAVRHAKRAARVLDRLAVRWNRDAVVGLLHGCYPSMLWAR